jgi:hypothetical protein
MTYEIIENPKTGHVNQDLFKLIQRKLTRLVGSKKFYIGKTGRDPEYRFREHIKKNPKWTKMIVLYSSKSKKYVENLEYHLVYSTYQRNSNCTGGGGGPLSAKHHLNYVYALIQ